MKISNVRFVIVLITMASLWSACVLVPTVVAQQDTELDAATDANADKGAPNEQPEEQKSVRVYALKNTNGQQFPEMLSSLSPKANIVFDATTNRLLVMASPSAQRRLENLIKELDTLPPVKDSIKVFPLLNADASSMLDVLSQLTGGEMLKGAGLRLSVDPRTNNLIAAGPRNDLDVIEAILLKLDEQQASQGLPDRTFRVRIVWFAEKSGQANTVKQNDDLIAVQRELSRIGQDKLRPVGQTVVSTAAGGKFRVDCSAALDNRAADLTIQGNLVLQQLIPHLAIEISAERVPSAERSDDGAAVRTELVNLSTEIVAPLGDYVVLGVTPVHEETIAFAVQVALMPHP